MKPEEKLRNQKKYVQYMNNGEKSIMLRWLENVSLSIRFKVLLIVLNKQINRKMRNRFRFG